MSTATVVHDSTALAVTAARAAASKKGLATTILDVAPLLAITDAFVITSGTSDRQVRTIAEEVERAVKEAGFGPPLRVEGLQDATWVLLDYGDVVVHVQHAEERTFYALERLWKDCPFIAFTDRAAAEHAAQRAAEA